MKKKGRQEMLRGYAWRQPFLELVACLGMFAYPMELPEMRCLQPGRSTNCFIPELF